MVLPQPDTRFDMKFARNRADERQEFFRFWKCGISRGDQCKILLWNIRASKLTSWPEFVKRPQLGERIGLCSVQNRWYQKFLSIILPCWELKSWVAKFNAQRGDMMCCWQAIPSRRASNEWARLLMGDRLGFGNKNKFSALWVLISRCWNGVKKRKGIMPCTHPFTSPKPEDIKLLDTDPGK